MSDNHDPKQNGLHDPGGEHWTARFAQPVIFIIVTLVAVGAYLAFAIPVSVFPSTDFPRIILGVDNGVAPINQMQVTVTRPIEESMNSVPGLQLVKSVTSRGTADPVPPWRRARARSRGGRRPPTQAGPRDDTCSSGRAGHTRPD